MNLYFFLFSNGTLTQMTCNEDVAFKRLTDLREELNYLPRLFWVREGAIVQRSNGGWEAISEMP